MILSSIINKAEREFLKDLRYGQNHEQSYQNKRRTSQGAETFKSLICLAKQAVDERKMMLFGKF